MKIYFLLLLCIVALATGLPDGTCPDVDPIHPVYLPDTVQCAYFHQCSHGIAYRFICPPGTYWDQQESVCNTVVNCGNLRTTTWLPTGPTGATPAN
ncbi:uncharacterized protein [Leptinotarsa decemlineata]|uniref:uncharacterized protein n=1 Tax=Leptinotarsa decemlineata TaxID=7539 RepID=UPI003D307354